MTYGDYLDLTKEFKYEDFPIGGVNEDGERVIIDRYDGDEENYFKITTFQHNDWIRITYVYQGGTTEEIYER